MHYKKIKSIEAKICYNDGKNGVIATIYIYADISVC